MKIHPRDLIWRQKMLEISAAHAVKQSTETADHHTTPTYIWRTRGDGHVRPEHADNDGRTFSWNDPPSTGHPGEAPGCRCWAEAYGESEEDLKEFSNQAVADFDPDVGAPWDIFDFYDYYKAPERMRLGAPGAWNVLTLSQVGHMQNILDYVRDYSQPEGGSIYQRFASNMFKEARQKGSGTFLARFRRSYDVTVTSFAFRSAVIDGLANVAVVDLGDFLSIEADIDYSFYDRYTDPYDFQDHSDDFEDDIYDDGIPYDILSSWSVHLSAIIRKDVDFSKYPDDEFGER